MATVGRGPEPNTRRSGLVRWETCAAASGRRARKKQSFISGESPAGAMSCSCRRARGISAKECVRRKLGQRVVARGAQHWEPDLDNQPQLRNLTMIKKVGADLAATTSFKDQGATRDPGHIPAHKGSREAARQFKFKVGRQVGTALRWLLRQVYFSKYWRATTGGGARKQAATGCGTKRYTVRNRRVSA